MTRTTGMIIVYALALAVALEWLERNDAAIRSLGLTPLECEILEPE